MPTASLYPNGAGYYTGLNTQYPASGEHWDKVKEVTPDDDTTYVAQVLTANIGVDSYVLDDLPEDAGVITSVRVWAKVRSANSLAPLLTSFKILARTGGNDFTNDYFNYNDCDYHSNYKEWFTNPNTGNAWTVSEINALQVGVIIDTGGDASSAGGRCTWVAVGVDYDLAVSAFIPKVFIM